MLAREYGFSSWPALMKELSPGIRLPREPSSSEILVYTNGSSAVDLLREAGVEGELLEWSDVLTDGEVPLADTWEQFATHRAKVLASLGFAGVENIRSRFAHLQAPLQKPDAYRELQLWFEQDLFDQLLLAQLICQCSQIPGWENKAVLYQFSTYLGRLTPETLTAHQPTPVPISVDHQEEAYRLWKAFCQPEPFDLQTLRRRSFQSLPFATAALHRLCEEFPSARNGLTRTEQQVLEGIQAGHHTPGTLFRFNQDQEEDVFMGDASFFNRVAGLAKGKAPCVQTRNGSEILHPSIHGYSEAFREQRFKLTPEGEEVLSGKRHRLKDLPDPYWVGGCRISTDHAFVWDADSETFHSYST